MATRDVTACVLIIGNEILSGRTQDTNLSHIAQQLGTCGIRVIEARVIADTEDAIVPAVQDAHRRFDYVFTTGGIGPTHDDITAACIARAFDRPLIEHPQIAEKLRRHPAPDDVMEARLRMARVPEGASLIGNPTGGPEGFRIENVYVMAGIPRVMQAMLSTALPELRGGAPMLSRSLTAYVGESRIAQVLGRIQDNNPAVEIGSYPFSRDGRFGTTLVIRGSDQNVIDAVYDAVQSAVAATGAEQDNP